MKKAFFAFSAIASVFFFSCSSDSSESNQTVNATTIKTNSVRFKASDFAYLGTEHNRILELARQNMNDNSIDFMKCQDETYNFIAKEVSNYKTTPEDHALAKEYSYDYMYYEPYDTSEHIYDIKSEFVKNNMSANSLAALDELRTVIYTDIDLSTKINEIEKIEDKVYLDNAIKNQELTVVFTATNVAKSSLAYWEENYNKWDEMFTRLAKEGGYSSKYSTFGFGGDLFDIVTGDVIGGAGAALGAWAANVFIGPGTIAYGGAIVAGAVGTSAVVAGTKIANQIKTAWVRSRR